MTSRLTSACLLSLLLSVGLGCTDDGDGAEATVVSAPEGEALLAAADQPAGGHIVVARATLPSPGGYVAIYESRNDAPGPVLGSSSLLAAGEHRDIRVDLDTEPEPGTEVFIMLHGEASGDDELEYPGPDEPISVEGRILTVTVTLG